MTLRVALLIACGYAFLSVIVGLSVGRWFAYLKQITPSRSDRSGVVIPFVPRRRVS